MMPDPSNQQLRQIIGETIAMPLGSNYCASKLPYSKYFCFYGSMGSGKTMMVRALAHECDAIVLDISPMNLEGKYMDRAGTNKMLYMVFTCAKVFQPSIIIMNDLELVLAGGKGRRRPGGFARLKKPI
jgi:ATP-dependent 26S proteasome regulatory subunit